MSRCRVFGREMNEDQLPKFSFMHACMLSVVLEDCVKKIFVVDRRKISGIPRADLRLGKRRGEEECLVVFSPCQACMRSSPAYRPDGLRRSQE